MNGLYNQCIIQIELTDFSPKEIKIKYVVQMESPDNVNEFNKYCDKYNDTFGDIDDYSSYYSMSRSYLSYFYVNLTENLATECNDTNCILCLENDRNYCITCIDDNYTIINDENYESGKIKICIKEEGNNESNKCRKVK